MAATGGGSLAAFLAACGGSSTPSGGNPTRTVGFSFPYTAVDVYKPLIAGARQSGAKRNWKVLESTVNGNFADKQLAEIEAWIAQKVDAIVALPIDANAVGPLIDKAHKAGIKWVTYSTHLGPEDGSMKWDDVQGSDLVTEAAVKWLAGKTNVKVGQIGLDSVPVGKARDDEMRSHFMSLVPNAQIVATAQANTAADAYHVALPMLQAHRDINVMLCVNDDPFTGILQAAKTIGIDPKGLYMCGLDGAKTAMLKLQSNEIQGADGALDLIAIGNAVVDLPANIYESKQPSSIVFKYILVDNDTPDALKKAIDSYGA
jgi:ABC-type sugar transport system substrate-binding protein